MNRTLVIAEAGVNHNGSLENAFKLVDVAKSAGADYVKFQTFKAGKLVTASASMADYQKVNTGVSESQYEMLKRLELSESDHYKLLEYCAKQEIGFLSTPFDVESLHFLTKTLGLSLIKLGSGELTNGPLLMAAARTGKSLILSTGMATMKEIEEALEVLAFGYLKSKLKPSRANFKRCYKSKPGQNILRKKVAVLHCTTEYPAPLEEVNLLAMNLMAYKFQLPIGYSDHTQGITVPIAAVALGAQIIEKHFTLDRNMEGPDHKASLEPDELHAMIKAIRDVEESLGEEKKGPTSSEIKNRKIARKSLVAAKPIKKGEKFSVENVTAKRPEGGLSPMDFWTLEGKAAKKNYETDEYIAEQVKS